MVLIRSIVSNFIGVRLMSKSQKYDFKEKGPAHSIRPFDLKQLNNPFNRWS